MSAMNRYIRKTGNTLIQFGYMFGKSRPQLQRATNSKDIPDNGTPAEAYIAPVYKDRSGIVTIISDDGHFSTGKMIDFLSNKYDIPFTIGGAVINVAWHEAWWKKTITSNSRMELVNHSYNHIRMENGSDIAASTKRLIHELIHSKRYFEKRFGAEQICFVCPENQMCSKGYELLRQSGILAVRQGTRGYNDLSPNQGEEPGEWYNLKTMGIMDQTGREAREMRKKWLKDAVKEKKWLIEMWHNISDDEDGGYQTILREDAEKHLAEIKELSDNGQLWAAKFTEAVKYIVERQHCSVIAVNCNDELHLSLAVRPDGIDTSVFDHPLTVMIRDYGKNIEGLDGPVFKDGSAWYMAELLPGEAKEFSAS